MAIASLNRAFCDEIVQTGQLVFMVVHEQTTCSLHLVISGHNKSGYAKKSSDRECDTSWVPDGRSRSWVRSFTSLGSEENMQTRQREASTWTDW